MPLYDFKCNECDSLFESFIKSSTDSHVECPWCSSTDTSKMLSSPMVSMKSHRFVDRTDNGFKEVIARVQERNPRTAICER